MHQGSMAGQPSRAIATKGVSDDGAAEWTITFEDGSVEKYPEVDTADNPQSFPNLFSNLGEAGFWALIDPSDDTMVQAMRNHVLGGAQLEKQTNEVATVSFDIIVVHVFPLRWLLKRLAFGSWSSEAPCATPPSHHPCHPPPIHFDSVLNTISSICALLQMSLGSLGAMVCGRTCACTPS